MPAGHRTDGSYAGGDLTSNFRFHVAPGIDTLKDTMGKVLKTELHKGYGAPANR
ncbi:MAG TPA: hypothetical protein VEZ14_10810 [Dehalococcoidia bacterium]|nr:hypothetical protein [Dehalococcoidia bacterium]